MSRKKILSVITKSNWGGAQRYVYDLATALPREKFDVTVALGGTGGKDAGAGKLEGKLWERNIRTIFIKSFMRDISFFKEFAALFELVKIFKKENPDVVHLNSSKAGGVGALAARMAGIKKIIFTSHGLAYDEDRNILTRGAIFFATWTTFLLCHKVIVISKDNERRAGCLPFCNGKISLICNGIYPIEFLSRDAARTALAARAAFPIPEAAVWIGTIAELTKNKGLSCLIQAAKILKDTGNNFVVIIIGAGEEKESLVRQISEAKLEKVVYLLGFVPEASKYLSVFDIFTLPSIKEGLPYALMEAGLASLPVVASDISGSRDIIEDGISGFLFQTKDSVALADKLKSLIGDAKTRKSTGGRLRQRVESRFSVSNMVVETTKLFT